MKVHPKKMQWIIKRLSMIVGVFFILLVIIAAIRYRKKTVVAEDGLHIEIIKNEEGNKFVRKADVKRVLYEEFGHAIVGQALEVVDIEEIEKVLEGHMFIKSADVYVTALNEVHITIEQRVPMMRVMDMEDESYYLDKFGNRVPTSTKFTARVIVVTGYIGVYNANYQNVKNNRLSKLYELVKRIDNNPFWKAQFEQVFMDQSGDVTLVPKIGDHKIYFGKPDVKVVDKLHRLEVFYKEGLPVEGWGTFKSINLSFDGQVVAKKR